MVTCLISVGVLDAMELLSKGGVDYIEKVLDSILVGFQRES